MYTTVIGRTFLDAYNKRENLNYTAKEFFEKVFFPLAYNSNKYFQWITNSEFVQGLRKKIVDGKKTDELEPFTIEERNKKLEKFHEKIRAKNIDASTAIGFAAAENTSYTSGQISDINYYLKEDDIYCSWFGSCLGLCVKGNFSIYFDNPKILLDIFDGWKYYREFLESNEYKKLKGNEIEYWNSHWIYHIADEFIETNPLQGITTNLFKIEEHSKISIIPIGFSQLIFALSKYFGETEILSFIYKLGAKINMTIGFIPFKLFEVQTLIQLYKKLFGENTYLKDAKKIESLYGTAFGFAAACQRGQIGIQALEPKGLRQYMTNNHGKVKLPNYSKADDEKIINYNTYITWVIAMLDNEKLWELAGEVADNLTSFIAADEKGETSRKRSNAINEILEVKNKKQFLEALIPIMNKTDNINPFVQLGYEINKMAPDNFPYFHTLIRFRYAEKNK